MAGTPVPKTKELAERVNNLWDQVTRGRAPLNEFEWRRIYLDIEKLGSIAEFAPESLRLRAIMHTLKSDSDQAQKALNQHAARFGKTREWYLVSISIAPLLIKPEMVIEVMDEHYPTNDKYGLLISLNAATQVGLFSTAKRILDDLEKMGPLRIDGISDDAGAHVPGITNAASYLQAHNLDEKEISKRIAVAAATVSKYERATKFTMLAGEFGIMFDYVIQESIEKLVDIDLDITEALCNSFEDTLSRHISIGVTPKEREL